MGVILDQPKFPVVDRAPSFGKIVGNFSFGDYSTWALVSGISLPAGYAAGYRTPLMAKKSAIVAGGIGALAGFLLGYQNSAGRLMGLLPNDSEVNKHLQKA